MPGGGELKRSFERNVKALRLCPSMQRNGGSPAPEASVMQMPDEADALSPLRDDFSRALILERTVRITAPVE